LKIADCGDEALSDEARIDATFHLARRRYYARIFLWSLPVSVTLGAAFRHFDAPATRHFSHNEGGGRYPSFASTRTFTPGQPMFLGP
jgi:hypothetical protein